MGAKPPQRHALRARVLMRSTVSRMRWGVALLALGFASHALAIFDDDEARRRIEVLRQQVEASQKAAEERLAKVEASAADRAAILELSNQINAMRDELAKMRGQIEVMTNQVEGADRRQKDLYLDIDTRLRKLEQAGEKAAAE